MAPSDRRATALRLVVTLLVLGGGYAGLCYWSSQHVPATVSVGGVRIGGMTTSEARTAIEKGTASLVATPIALSVPGGDSLEVVPSEAGLAIDIDRSLEGLTGFTLHPVVVWERLAGSVNTPLLTRTDDAKLTSYVNGLAPKVETKPKEGALTFPEGRVTIDLPAAGRRLDVPATKLALRRAFPDSTHATATVQSLEPQISAEVLKRAASEFGRTAMAGPVLLTSGTVRASIAPADFAPFVTVVPDGSRGLAPKFDEKRIGDLVASRIAIPSTTPSSARWVFAPGNGKPSLVPAVNGTAVDRSAVTKAVVAAISSERRQVEIKPVVVEPPFTTADAQRAGVTTMIADFSSPFPAGDPTRTNNLVVATRTINGTYVPPGGTFSLNTVLGERTTAKGYQDGTVIINGRLTRGTGGGVSQVSTVIYNLAYFSGVDFLEFSPHAFFIPRYPEGREATVFWPYLDNRWKNDTAHGMLLQTWVEGGNVRGRVWSTKNWDIRSVKGARSEVVPPQDVKDNSLTCYPQSPQPGFKVTVTRQWFKPGSATLVKQEPITTRYKPEDKITCTNPDAKP